MALEEAKRRGGRGYECCFRDEALESEHARTLRQDVSVGVAAEFLWAAVVVKACRPS